LQGGPLIWLGIALLGVAVLAHDGAAQTPTSDPLNAPQQPSEAVSHLSGIWFRAWHMQQLFDPPDRGPGPVTGDPAWPHVRGTNAPWIADLDNPILQPATRDRLKQLADEQKAGRAMMDNDSLCLPFGVLASLNMFDALQILQTRDQVIFLYARDHQVRFVYLDQPHAKNIAPSWYGESIGHYEGDTLVVDTVGQNDRTLVDRYGTPHSVQLHTVERYRYAEDDGMLHVSVTVEDPIAFITPWSAQVAYKREPGSTFEEIVCAENNRAMLGQGIRVPTATSPDF
jgi:hypothetical protein